MGNIADSTSLSDLLHTSPRQQSTSNHEGLRLDLASKTSVAEVSEPAQTDPESSSTTVGNTAIQAESSELNAMETMLSQQSIKIQLVERRNEVLKYRAALRDEVDDLRLRIKHLTNIRQHKMTKQSLETLLQQNSVEAFPQDTPKMTFSASNDDDSILQNLNVLPSNDWDERLKQARKFYPYLELENASTANLFSEKDGKLVRTISFVLASPLLFKIPLKLHIDTRDESITEIELTTKKQGIGLLSRLKKPRQQCASLTTLALLSPSLVNMWSRNYLPRNKINLVMYSASSLSILLHKRISLMYKLIRTYHNHIYDKAKFEQLVQETELQDNIQLFAILRSVDTVRLEMSADLKSYIVSFQWEIVHRDSVTGECESELRLTATNMEGKSAFSPMDSVFQKLVQQYGVLSSLKIVFGNTFGIDV